MSVVAFHRNKEDAARIARDTADFQEIQTALRHLLNHLDAATVGVGSRFGDADFAAREQTGRRIAWITRQMLEADQGKITWADARINALVVSPPSWLDLPEFKVPRESTDKRRKELSSVLFDIARPQLPEGV